MSQDIRNRRFTEILGPQDIHVPEKIDSSKWLTYRNRRCTEIIDIRDTPFSEK